MVLSSPPPALAQELWNHILLFLRGHTKDLKSCCLVSHVLCLAAQCQLFHTIAILPFPKTTVWINKEPVCRTNEVPSCRRLRTICVQSPHHIQNIRRLELPYHAELLKEILAMQLVCLREVEFRPRWDAIDTKRLDERTLKLAQRLLSRPTIERAEFRSMYQPAAFFSRLFADTTPQLRELDFDACELYSGEQHKPAPARITPPPRHVASLRISGFLSPPRSHPGCSAPRACSTLHTSRTRTEHPARCVEYAAGAVLATADVDHCPPLGLFPALVHLTLNAYAEVTAFFPMLETLDPANGLCTITLSLAGGSACSQLPRYASSWEFRRARKRDRAASINARGSAIPAVEFSAGRKAGRGRCVLGGKEDVDRFWLTNALTTLMAETFTLHFPDIVRVAGEIVQGHLRGSIVTKITETKHEYGPDGPKNETHYKTQTVQLLRVDQQIWDHFNSPQGPETLVCPFQIQLPQVLPPSFHYSHHAHTVAISYSIEVVGSRHGLFHSDRRVRKIFSIVPAASQGELQTNVALRQGWNGQWKRVSNNRELRHGLFGDHSEAMVELVVPDLPSYPMFTGIPFSFHVGEKLFPAPPDSPADIEFMLHLMGHMRAHGKDGELNSKYEIKGKWTPSPEHKNKGSWKRAVHFEGLMSIPFAPTFTTETAEWHYMLRFDIDFPGMGNHLSLEFPIHLNSGVACPPLPAAAYNASVPYTYPLPAGPPPMLNLPAEYWSGKDHDWDEEQ
ncbi:hypothetical protein B0H13DRAFT_2649970 [Mycena leptocephala]|nr:hypothetical protein B0H13DRAFT_2649970 [Mycena leptocephala]